MSLSDRCRCRTGVVLPSVAQAWLQAGKSGGGHCFREMACGATNGTVAGVRGDSLRKFCMILYAF